MTLLENIY